METSEAREHLEIVNRVLERAEQRLCVGGEFFVAWGLVAAAIDVVTQLVFAQGVDARWLWLPAVVVAGAIVFSVVRSRALKVASDRLSQTQLEYFKVLWLTLGVTAIVQVAAYPMFPGPSAAAIWTFAATIVTGYIALHGDRRALICASILIASLVGAAYAPQFPGYVLAAGMLLGYAGFGAASLLARD